MISLRILGRGNCCDDLNEFSSVGESTCNTIFHTFVKEFVEHFFVDFVSMPSAETLKQSLDIYAKLGLPGAVFSMDCTHLYLDKCPVEFTNICTGKEGKPTLAFQLAVDHFRRIYHCSQHFYGSFNDKTITVTHNDEFVRAVMNGVLQDIEYVLIDDNGVPFRCKGGFIIVDGGYFEMPIFMNPFKLCFSDREILWSEMMESVRKDVECVNGILKCRFRWLKNPIQYHEFKTIEYAMKTCCILHNMLLSFDRIGLEAYLDESMWDRLDPDLTDELAEQDMDLEPTDISFDEAPVIPFNITHVSIETINNMPLLRQFGTTSTFEYNDLRSLLVIHFNQKMRMQQIVWPKSIASNQRANISYFTRAREEAEKALYHKPSILRLKDRQGRQYTGLIGDGLFSHVMYQGKKESMSGFKAGDPIAKFRGVIKSIAEYDMDAESGKGGYAVLIREGFVLDCYDEYKRGVCKASWANCPTNCFDTIIKSKAKANAYITVDTNRNIVQLRALTNIQPHVEIKWKYGDEYVYPSVN